jgi:acyl-coenzyme A thioesterase PaaI-like protein
MRDFRGFREDSRRFHQTWCIRPHARYDRRMPESFRTRLERWGFNFFPAYRGTGARITYIAGDHREIRIKLPLNWRTRNYVGTIFGGSIYAAVDPVYMIMLIKNLGRDYLVWDKSATIRFRKPGRSTLFATFLLTQKELDEIRAELLSADRIDRVYVIHLVDADATVHAEIEKTIHVRRNVKS